jgi:hypothetical protein
MDWSSTIGVFLIGAIGLSTLALAIWGGNVVMNLLGDDEQTMSAALNKSRVDQLQRGLDAEAFVPSGQEQPTRH